MKKIVSVLLILTLALNIFGFGVLRSRVYAVAPALIPILELAKNIAIGFIGGATAEAIVEGAGVGADFNAEYFNTKTTEALNDGKLIEAYLDDHNFTVFTVSENCPSESSEFAAILVDELNSIPDAGRFVDPYMGSTMKASDYERVKTKVVNAYTKMIESKRLNEAWQLLDEPAYGFSFTGPLTPIQMKSTTEWTSTDFEGWHFSTPSIYDGDGTYFPTEASCISHGANNYYLQYANHWNAFYNVGSRCNYSTYVVYNNELFLFPSAGYSSSGDIRIGDSIYDLTYFVSKSGHHLSDYVSDYHGLVFGFVYTTDTTLNYAVLQSDDLDVSDFEVTTPGATIDQAYSSDEAPVAAAVAAGILPADSENIELGIDSSGNIVSANGITIEQLQALADQLTEGQIQFEDFEEYLSYITALLMHANVNTDTITDVLNGLRAYEQQQTNALDQINANIASISEAITSSTAITASKDFDIDTPDIITDKFPFSLPFDIYHIFNIMSAEPQAPKFTLPLHMNDVFDYDIEVDLTEYEWIANIVRWLLYVVFVVGLILGTNKLIGRG